MISLLSASIAVAGPADYEIRTWPALTDRDWSAHALRLRRTDAGSWYYAEGGKFIIAGTSLRHLERAALEATSAFAFFEERLALPTPVRKAVVLLVGDQAAWTNLAARGEFRPDGEGVQVGREVFIRVGADHADGRVAHELAHFVLREAVGRKLPLCLEEGLALRWGWKALLDGPSARPAPRRIEALSPERLTRWDLLFAVSRYPADAAEAVAFYRQAEESVAALEARFGERGVAQLAREVGKAGGDLQRVLAARGWKAEDFSDWSKDAMRRCRETRVEP